MMAANYRHIGGGENRLGRHYSRFAGIWPTSFLADQSLTLRKSQNAGSNRPSRANACRPPFQQNELPGALIQYSKFDTRDVRRVRQRELGGFDTHWRPVIRVELPKLDEDRTTGFGAGRVAAGRRVANISTRRVVAALVLKYALQHQELLAT